MVHLNNQLLFTTILSVLISCSQSASVTLERRNIIDTSQGLYNASDEVEDLTTDNFNQKIYGSKRAWLVEFYNAWCGHCQRYAPVYKRVADYFKNSKDIFVIAAVDCANELNQPLCRNFEIMGYPTLRYFPENYIEGDENLGITVEKGDVDDVNGNIRVVIDKLISEQKENRAKMIPNLIPYEVSDISKFFDNLSSDVKFGFLILESDKSQIGVETVLNLHKVSNIHITYSLFSNSKLADSLTMNELPALVILSRGAGSPKIENKIPRIEHAVRHIASFLKQNDINVDQYISNDKENKPTLTITSEKERDQKELLDRIKKMGDVVFQMDLETALRFSLRQEVGRRKLITGNQLDALKAYVKVLAKYFPLGKKGRFFLNDLNTLVSTSDSIKGIEIALFLKESEENGKMIWSSPKDWLGCQGSNPGFRGYPCGMWTMFHYLTVNAAEQNLGKAITDPNEVLRAMHGYIANFFGCADCSQHFQQMAAERKLFNVSSYRDAIIWLWEAHNVVNTRLAGDQTEDPEHPKVQYPTPDRCPNCRHDNGTYNVEHVEKYLKHVYANINVRYIGSDTRILHMGLEGVPSSSSGDFVSVDSKTKWATMVLLSAYLSYVNARH